MFTNALYFVTTFSLVCFEFEITSGFVTKNERNQSDTDIVFWASSTTIRVLTLQNRTVIKNVNNDVGEALTNIAYNPKGNFVLFSSQLKRSEKSLNVMSLENGLITTLWLSTPNKMRADWYTGNIFIQEDGRIDVVNLYYPTIFQRARTSIRKKFKGISDFVVHPGYGLLFWTESYEKNIIKSWLDGTNSQTIFNGFGTLALDHLRDVLYVASNSSIVVLDLDGKILRTIYLKLPTGNTTMYDFGNLELCDNNLIFSFGYDLFYLDLTTEETVVVAHSEEKSTDLKTYCRNSFPMMTTPCTDQNTKCAEYQICLHSPKGVTQCHSNKFYHYYPPSKYSVL